MSTRAAPLLGRVAYGGRLLRRVRAILAMEALRCVGLLAAFGGLTVGCSEDGKLDAGVPLAHDLAVVDAESIGPGDEGAPCVRDFGWLANEPVDLSVAGCSDTCYQPDAFPQFARNCTSDCDCLVATYWSDCCGTQRSVGYSSSVAAEARRTLLAYNYVCCRPICTCASKPTTCDVGGPVATPGQEYLITAACRKGTCVSVCP